MDLLDKYLLNILCGRLWRDFGWRVTEAQRRPGSQEHGLQDRSQMFYREAHLILKYRLTYLTFMHSLVPLCPPSWKTEYKYGTTGRPLGFSGDSEVKNLPAMHETWVQSLGQEDTLEKEMPIINTGLLKRDEILLGKCLSGIFILGRKMRSMFDQMCPEI